MAPADQQTTTSVLVIRDEPVIRHFFQFANKHGSLTVLMAASAPEALETSRNFDGHIDFVLTNRAPADSDGDENIRAIRAEHPHSRLLRIAGGRSLADPGANSAYRGAPGSKEVLECAAALLAEISEAIARESRAPDAEPVPRPASGEQPWRSAAGGTGETRIPQDDKQLLSLLTPREIEVLTLIGEGNRTKEIAHLLGITFRTALTHRANIMEKLGIHDGPGLIRLAIRTGLCTA